MTTLLMSPRHAADDQALWRAAVRRGWPVVRVRGLRLPEIADAEIVIYVEALYAPTIAAMIGRSLLEPADDWLCRLPQQYRQREIRLTSLGAARDLRTPAFIKPPNDKSFAAEVHQSGASLPAGFEDQLPVLVAEPVQWQTEFRCFCLEETVQTLSPYLRSGVHAGRTQYEATSDELRTATEFAEAVLAATGQTTPRAIVLDVGQIAGRGWAVVEANGAWGSGIYGCDPEAVLDVVRHATVQPPDAGA